MANIKIYLLVKSKATVEKNYKILVKDIAEVCCDDKGIKDKVENTIIYKTNDVEDWISMSSIYIIEKLLDKTSNLDIEVIGESEVLVEIKERVKPNNFLRFAKVTAIFILLFFGAGITIMNFHTDVDMDESLEIIYHVLTGKQESNPLIMTVPYSIGLGLGAILFFSRIISRNPRRRKEPGPMEIELFSYDKEMEEFILNDIDKSSKE